MSLLFVSVRRHQAGWFPFNLENELLQLPGDRANQDDMEGELQNHDLQEMVAASHPSQLYQEHYPGLMGFLSVAIIVSAVQVVH